MDDMDLIKNILEQHSKTLRATDARLYATIYILMEVVRHLAYKQDAPSKFLSALFDGVSDRLDQLPPEQEAQPLIAAIREELSQFFAHAGIGPGKI